MSIFYQLFYPVFIRETLFFNRFLTHVPHSDAKLEFVIGGMDNAIPPTHHLNYICMRLGTSLNGS